MQGLIKTGRRVAAIAVIASALIAVPHAGADTVVSRSRRVWKQSLLARFVTWVQDQLDIPKP